MKSSSRPGSGAPSPDQPVRSAGGFGGPRGPGAPGGSGRGGGTPRSTQLVGGFSKASTFSRSRANWFTTRGISRPLSCLSVSAMNSGSVIGSVAMNFGSMVRLLLTRWQVAQVRPLPPNGARKNRSAPTQVSSVTTPTTTRGSAWHAATRSSSVIDAWTEAAADGSSDGSWDGSTADSAIWSGGGPASVAAQPAPARTAIKSGLQWGLIRPPGVDCYGERPFAIPTHAL